MLVYLIISSNDVNDLIFLLFYVSDARGRVVRAPTRIRTRSSVALLDKIGLGGSLQAAKVTLAHCSLVRPHLRWPFHPPSAPTT